MLLSVKYNLQSWCHASIGVCFSSRKLPAVFASAQPRCPSQLTAMALNMAATPPPLTYWWASCCGFPPSPRQRHFDWARRGGGGWNQWRHWCTGAGSVEETAHRHLPLPSWRIGMIQLLCCSRDDRETSWSGMDHLDLGRNQRGKAVASKSDSGQLGPSWLTCQCLWRW